MHRVTPEETTAKKAVLLSKKGLLEEKPLSFETIVILGVIPQWTSNIGSSKVFSCLFGFLRKAGCDLVLESHSPQGITARIKAKDINKESFHNALLKVGNTFDVLVYSADPRWACIVSAHDGILVLGGTHSFLEGFFHNCGSLEKIWSAVKATLIDPAFSEPFWATQSDGVLRYP